MYDTLVEISHFELALILTQLEISLIVIEKNFSDMVIEVEYCLWSLLL